MLTWLSLNLEPPISMHKQGWGGKDSFAKLLYFLVTFSIIVTVTKKTLLPSNFSDPSNNLGNNDIVVVEGCFQPSSTTESPTRRQFCL